MRSRTKSWLRDIGGSVNLGSLYGIPVRLHFTWFLVFALVTFSLAFGYFPSDYQVWERVVAGGITSIFFFASVIAHELCHSIVAVRSGIPVKSITLFVFGGLSEITKEASRPGIELAMAAAGPLSSFVLAAFFFGLVRLTQRGDVPWIIASLVGWLASINLMLGLFNLIPGFPLDGGRILRAALWRISGNFKSATRTASQVGRGVAYLFIVGGIALMFFSGNWFDGIWLAFIGWFLVNAASSSYQQVHFREALRGFKALDLMNAEYSSIPPGLSLAQLVQEYILPLGRRSFLVVADGLLLGAVSMQAVRDVPQQRWGTTQVGQIMMPLKLLKAVSPQEDAFSVLDLMDSEGIEQLPVVEDGRAQGVISRDSLLRFVRVRSELGM